MFRIIKYLLTEEQMETLYNKYNDDIDGYDNIEEIPDHIYSEWIDNLIEESDSD